MIFAHGPLLSAVCRVGMMALQAGKLAEQEAKVVAHAPVEKKVTMSHGFAASGAQH